MTNATKTRCKQGHLLAGDNLRMKIRQRNGHIYRERECVECHRLHNRVYQYKTQTAGVRLHVTPQMFRPKYDERRISQQEQHDQGASS